MFHWYQFSLFGLDCYCETHNGKPGRNGIFCKVDSTFVQSGFCKSDEYCTGPSHSENATKATDLCSKGANNV